ncbi:MAG: phosphoenolpyruvate carboxykinase (GTP) [Armatimonadetes bacterium]|nr:phosphoenolpyruvate carboxykinase (GTP) [Armatimonadota bacterium]MCX7968202.1 phosphoenolpyruvate carboxykinase (GTP) [Armatimonadota bacterium]MDW8144284.1 phosphoenolpyruvate carboxykinase (GTP) [Armatimonadota bacterium]
MGTPLEEWVEEQARLTQPERIYWCDGSEEEAHRLIEIGLKEEKLCGRPVFHELNQKLWPNSYLHRSHPTDVARTEHLTFVCHPDRETAGPTNNWMDPKEAKELLTNLTKGCMKGRTMYVLPYMMGHPNSPYARACVQLTDSVYVAVSMRIMTRMGKQALERIGNSEDFVRGLHSIGDLDPNRRFIMHFPDENLVWSIGSGYGGNALLGKKCFSLRIASWLGYHQGWLAEHMIIIGIEAPEGDITYIAAAFPSACGKTNLAMLESPLTGYKVWTLGDDIAWLNIGHDGRLYAINPETGFFGVAPGTSEKTNPNMMRTLKAGTFYPTLFTNTALNVETNEPWWDGLTETVPSRLLDWQGRPWDLSFGEKAAHPNSRFTVSIYQCPTLSPEFDNPKGVPISAIIFGARRSATVPLVYESFNWQHGVFIGASMASETTPAAVHQVGVLRRDPMAMLPFCGYNMADYFRHWLEMGRRMPNPPKIFFVNWFRKDESGEFLWLGFSENMRVLKWIVERVKGKVGSREIPVGFVPHLEDLDLEGLKIPNGHLEKLFAVNYDEWQTELEDIRKFFEQFGDRLPTELWQEYHALKKRLERLVRCSM